MTKYDEMSESEKINLHYLSGFNDALMLILAFDVESDWECAMARFDFENALQCEITQSNLKKVRDFLEAVTD